MTSHRYDEYAYWYLNKSVPSGAYAAEPWHHTSAVLWMVDRLPSILDVIVESEIICNPKVVIWGKGGRDNRVLEHEFSARRIIRMLSELSVREDVLTDSFTIEGRPAASYDEDQNNIIRVGCHFFQPRVDLTVHSDCIVPIDLQDRLQIDSAEVLSDRLYRLLSELKQLGFDELQPNEGEEQRENNLLPQYGFRAYIHDAVLDFIDDELTSEQLQRIKPFLWSSRFDRD